MTTQKQNAEKFCFAPCSDITRDAGLCACENRQTHILVNDQSDPNAAYNAKCRKMADKLAFFRYKRETFFGAYFTEEDKVTHWNMFENKEGYIQGKMDEASAMVSEMANMLRKIRFEEAEGKYTNAVEMRVFRTRIDEELKERGLIPIPDTKTEKDARKRTDNNSGNI